MATSSTLSQTQRYAAGALLALALRQAQIHQTFLLGSHDLDDDPPYPDPPAAAPEPDVRDLWIHESRGLLRPVLRSTKAWPGVEKTAASSEPKHHIGAFLRKVLEDEDDDEKARSERSDHELALAKAIDAMAMGLEADMEPADLLKPENAFPDSPMSGGGGSPAWRPKDYRKMAVLYMLLSACVADVNMAEEGMGSPRVRKGYDARHRVALRLVATWLDVKWNKMEAVEIMVACSAMAAAKEEEQLREGMSPKSRWESWKRGGIIGAAALTGGTLMAISGGLAAPAIAAGFTAIAPTLHALIPVIGASGFAAIATAAGHTAGSVAVAASFGAAGAGLTGTKMAKRIGNIIDRYILQWESKHIIVLSTAMQDWIASRFAMELMREGAMQTVLSGIISAFAWPATLVSVADFIDSKWSVAIDRSSTRFNLLNIVDSCRSDKAGKMLAEVLLNGLQGSRYLNEFYLQSSSFKGIVERIVLIGAPVSVKGEMWEPARKMVAGRFVNVYSMNDWILGIAFRASLLTQGLAGIQAVRVPGVENVDVTDLVVGHTSYLSLVQQILDQLELNTYYPVFYPGTPRSR
ncbi:hypothetical protein PR202_ga07566 [Eleusine coracana subsp. coracana]|uniref:Uncharacterized protein n=1 Tax=Eleusine coracana subsp. coracana TaxID=191504 RepID=A0AAV5BZJ6_ELECO|nr:hypothetical protein PR202_ga07566 [Eleusine coracana subsp. coracana]